MTKSFHSFSDNFFYFSGQYREANYQLHQVLDFIKDAHADELGGYGGNNVAHILELLHTTDYNATNDSGSGGAVGSGLGSAERSRRHVFTTALSDMLSLHLSPRLHEALLQGSALADSSGENSEQTSSGSLTNKGLSGITTAGGATGSNIHGGASYLQTVMRLLRENIQLKSEIAKLYNGIRHIGDIVDESDDIDKEDLEVYRDLAEHRARRDTSYPAETTNRHVVHRHNNNHNHTRGGHHEKNKNGADFNSYASGGGESREDLPYHNGGHNTDYNNNNNNNNNNHNKDHDSVNNHQTVRSRRPSHGGRGHGLQTHVNLTHIEEEGHGHTQAEKLKEIAHILHFCSIGILGIFVAQVRGSSSLFTYLSHCLIIFHVNFVNSCTREGRENVSSCNFIAREG